jgi:hypothetical protein
VNSEMMLTTAADEATEELEASFLRGEDLPGFGPGLALLPAADILRPGTPGPGAGDDPAMRVTVRTRSSRCC